MAECGISYTVMSIQINEMRRYALITRIISMHYQEITVLCVYNCIITK